MPLATILWHAGDLLLAGAILAMLRQGLAPRYRAWWAFLVLQLVRDIALAFISFSSLLYARLFMASDVLGDIVLAVSIYEWFRLLADHYPGIKMAGTWVLNIGLGISVLVCLATVGRDWRAIDWAAPELYLALLARRISVGALGVFMILIFLAFAIYRVRVRPNVLYHGLLLTVYLWLQSTLAVTDAWTHLRSVHLTNSVREIALPVLYLGWATLLTRRGETVEFASRLTESESYQLDRLNDELLALARRSIRQN